MFEESLCFFRVALRPFSVFFFLFVRFLCCSSPFFFSVFLFFLFFALSFFPALLFSLFLSRFSVLPFFRSLYLSRFALLPFSFPFFCSSFFLPFRLFLFGFSLFFFFPLSPSPSPSFLFFLVSLVVFYALLFANKKLLCSCCKDSLSTILDMRVKEFLMNVHTMAHTAWNPEIPCCFRPEISQQGILRRQTFGNRNCTWKLCRRKGTGIVETHACPMA